MLQLTRSTISATQARLRFGEVIRNASAGPNPVVVEKAGIPVVVILSLPDYEQLLQDAKLGRFERMSRAARLDAERQGLSEEIRAHARENIVKAANVTLWVNRQHNARLAVEAHVRPSQTVAEGISEDCIKEWKATPRTRRNQADNVGVVSEANKKAGFPAFK